MEGHQPKAEKGFDPETAVPPPSGTGVTPPVQAQPSMPKHMLVDLTDHDVMELDNIVTHKQLALAQQKIAMKQLEDAQRAAMTYQKKETIMMARLASANGITGFVQAKMAPQGKVLFIL